MGIMVFSYLIKELLSHVTCESVLVQSKVQLKFGTRIILFKEGLPELVPYVMQKPM